MKAAAVWTDRQFTRTKKEQKGFPENAGQEKNISPSQSQQGKYAGVMVVALWGGGCCTQSCDWLPPSSIRAVSHSSICIGRRGSTQQECCFMLRGVAVLSPETSGLTHPLQYRFNILSDLDTHLPHLGAEACCRLRRMELWAGESRT